MSDDIKHIALIPLVFLSGEELHRWRIENEDVIGYARHMVEVYKLTPRDEQLESKMFEHLTDTLGILNSQTINVV